MRGRLPGGKNSDHIPPRAFLLVNVNRRFESDPGQIKSLHHLSGVERFLNPGKVLPGSRNQLRRQLIADADGGNA